MMTKFLSLIVISLVALSCGTKKNTNTSNDMDTSENTKVEIIVVEKIPYCGGAKPQPGMENRTKPVVGEFILTNLGDASETKVKSDENGAINMDLAPGKYGLKEIYKNVSFDKFLKAQRVEKPNIELGTEECYKTWWASNFLEFQVEEDELLVSETGTILVRCNTGINPCDRFTGQLAP